METNNTTQFLKENINEFFNPQNNKGSFSVLYTNIGSLRKNVNDLLVEFNSLKHKVNFIVLSVVWINSNQINLYNIPGHNLFINFNNNYRAGGV